MNRFIITSLLILITFFVSPNQTLAETPLDVYMNILPSNEVANLKEIEHF